MLQFVELPHFTDRVRKLLDDEAYRQLQLELNEHPDRGALIPHGGGLRKIRFAARGHGKSGGVRVIYYWFASDGQIFLLDIYAKNEKLDLTRSELKQLVGILGRL